MGVAHSGSFPLEDAVAEGVFHEREFDGCEIELKNPKNPAGNKQAHSVWIIWYNVIFLSSLQELCFCVLTFQGSVLVGLRLFGSPLRETKPNQ